MQIFKFLKNKLKISKALIILLGVVIFSLFAFGFLKDTKSLLVLAADTTSPDAIAIRVIPNPDHHGISRWYNEQGFKGSPQALTIDGYEALRDGRTVYVNAANVVGDELYTNIYLISYNQDAEAATKSILDQIISHWKFNTNIAGSEQKARITRDTKRLSRLAEIKIAVENYKEDKGYYPKLAAGTYLANKTISTWPSWQQTLAKELGVGLPTDPINKLGECLGYDSATCWKESDKTFAGTILADGALELPADSNALVYTAAADGSSYNVCAIMESGLVSVVLSAGACAGSAIETVQYGETAINHPPTITCGSLVGPPAKEFKGYISASDPNGDTLSWSINTGGTTWTGWSAPPEKRDTINSNQKEIHAERAGNEGSYSFSVTVDDGRGGQTTKTCLINIGSALPVVTPITDKEIVIGETLDFMIYATDPGGNYPLSFTINPSLNYTVEGDRNGHVSQTIDTSFSASPEGTNHLISVNAVNSASPGVSSPVQSFNLKVINHKPVITKPLSCAITVRTDSSYSCDIAATDPDGHTISYIISSDPANSGLTIDANGKISGTPTVAGNYTITVTAKDQYNAVSSPESFTLKVNTYCGDGIYQTTNGEGVVEKCDGSNNIAAAPAGSSLDKQYACDSTCQFTGGYCGDEVAQSDKEDCDGADLDGKDCVMAYPDQFTGGTLSCVNNCTFDTSQCISTFSISGNIKDYMSALPLEGVEVKAVKHEDGSIIRSFTTSSDGNYSLADIPALVEYNIIASKTDYADGNSGTFNLTEDKAIDFNLSGTGLQGAARFQLTWGSSPKDLDSHLKFGATHIYYGNKDENGAILDKDDINKYGPENIRIETLAGGATYKYFIHDYTHRNSCGSGSFNGAKIEVYNSGGVKVKEYTSTHTGNCYWYVLDMDDTGKITDKNIYTNNIKDIDPAL